MTSAEIVKALRCTATVQTGGELCASCPFDRAETLTEEQKVQLHCEEWHSCDVDGVALAAADLIERLEKEKALTEMEGRSRPENAQERSSCPSARAGTVQTGGG